ncbi:MAG: hypothetical protein ACRENP_29085 [Longimicrobiales bacterium]
MTHLDGRIDELLSPDATDRARADADAHLRECEACRRQWAGIIELDARLRADAIETPHSFRAGKTARTAWRMNLSRAAVVLLVALSAFGLGRWSRAAEPGPAQGDEFLLLLAGSRAESLPRDSLPRIFQRFGEWTAALRSRGQLVRQGQLGREGVTVSSESVGDPNLESALRQVNGYFIVRAESLEDAEQLARTSPYLELRGRIAVRAIGPPR